MLLFPALRVLALILLLGALIDATPAEWWTGRRNNNWDSDTSLPDGYFTLLRLVVTLSAAWDAWAHFRYAKTGLEGANVWALLLALVALIFQPVFPLHLEYAWWVWIDLSVFGLLLVHAYLVTRPLGKLMAEASANGASPLSVPQAMAEAATAIGYITASDFFVRVLPKETTALHAAGPSSSRAAGTQQKTKQSDLRQAETRSAPNEHSRKLEEEVEACKKAIDQHEHILSDPASTPLQLFEAERNLILAQRTLKRLIDTRSKMTAQPRKRLDL